MRWIPRSPLATLLLLACGDAVGGSSSDGSATQSAQVTVTSAASGDMPTTAAVTTDATTQVGSSDGGGGVVSTDDSGGVTKFDLPITQDIGSTGCRVGDPDCGCSAIDILFIVDNSGSMQEHAPGVIAAFDPFVEEMIEVLPPGTSLHIGVTRATGFYDPGDAGGWGGPSCEATIVEGVWSPPTAGDNGVNGQQGRLFEEHSLRYFSFHTDGDPSYLKGWFQNALIGAIDLFVPYSNAETVIAGAAYPFHPVNAEWNAGFLREQAVLVLFLLSDSPDLSPPEIPTGDFIEIVRDAKAACGNKCVITTGAIAEACYGQPGNTNTRLYDFMNGFGQPPPSWTALTEGEVADFDGVLGTALTELIGATCMAIPPE